MNKYLLLGLLVLIVVLVGAVVFISASEKSNINSFSNLTPSQFNKELSSGKYTLFDVRTFDEFKAGHIKGAKQSDYYQTDAFSKYLDGLDKNANYLIYCHTGRRSGLALQIMQQKGFTNVHDLAGGYAAWTTAGLPIEK